MARINFDVSDELRERLYEKIREENTTIKDYCSSAIEDKLDGLMEEKVSLKEMEEKIGDLEAKLEESMNHRVALEVKVIELQSRFDEEHEKRIDLLYEYKNVSKDATQNQKDLIELMKADRVNEYKRTQIALGGDLNDKVDSSTSEDEPNSQTTENDISENAQDSDSSENKSNKKWFKFWKKD